MSQQEDLENIEGEKIATSDQFEDIVTSTIEQFEVLDVLDPETTMLIQATQPMLPNILYQIVCPDALVLKPNIEAGKKRGRPRKSQNKPKPAPEPMEKPQKAKIKAKTRSGREVRLPRHIQKDFESLEVETDAKITETDVKIDLPKETKVSTTPVHVELQQKKRKIAAQYRCPKCQKAYLGKNKMLKHLQKYPSHGPVNQKQRNDFEVWNHLVSITRKSPSSERGAKFCQELSNLLHNLLLLTDALFKKVGNVSNEVEIDKVLGNAIGLSPGTYYFDDNNLYKDVTVLQLMENTDFLNLLKTEDKSETNLEPVPIIQPPTIDYEMKNAKKSLNEIDELATPTIDYEIKNNPKNNEEFDFSLNNYKNPDEEVLIDALIHPVDELMLPVSPSVGHNILDNSSSSDEVLNVDQFVNERFRKITESNLEETSNLLSELPPLELFQFHTT